MTRIERLEKALEVAQAGLRMFASSSSVSGLLLAEITTAADDTLQEIDVLLNPPPEMEEVQEVAWKDKETGLLHGVLPIGFEETGRFVKLTGTYKRPVPQPVERSVSVEVSWLNCDGSTCPVSNGEAIDWKSLVGKKGMMTFTWTEP